MKVISARRGLPIEGQVVLHFPMPPPFGRYVFPWPKPRFGGPGAAQSLR
jgi:hypothetical protein